MAVIKNHNANNVLKNAIVLDLGDVARQAKLLREEAQTQAQQIIADARQEAETQSKIAYEESKKRGYDDGYKPSLEEGLKNGREQGRQEAYDNANEQLDMIQQSWIDAAQVWDTQRQEMYRDARRAVLDLTLSLAQKLVHRVIEVDPEVIVDQMTSVLACVLRPTDVTVRICPDDRPSLEQAMPRLMTQFTQVKHIHLIDDPDIKRGGCVVGYGQGEIDASIDTQMQRLIELIVPDHQANTDASVHEPESLEQSSSDDDQGEPPQPSE